MKKSTMGYSSVHGCFHHQHSQELMAADLVEQLSEALVTDCNINNSHHSSAKVKNKNNKNAAADLKSMPTDLVVKIPEAFFTDFPTPAETASAKVKNRKSNKKTTPAELVEKLYTILYGDTENLPDPKSCTEVTKGFFKDNNNNPLGILITSFEKFDTQTQSYFTKVFASLVRQKVQGRPLASDYLESNLYLIEHMINRSIDLITQGEQQTALFYNCMFIESLRTSREITKHFLKSKTYVKIFIDYALKDNFVVGSFFEQTLEMLLTVHKSVVAEFLQDNHEWFFEEVNLRFLKSSNFLNKLFGLQLLEKMLEDSAVVGKYVNSLENLKIVMNLMREESKNKSFKSMAVGVFKRFLVNQKMPKEIAAVIILNKDKLLRLLYEVKANDQKKKEEADADAGDDEVTQIISSMDAESIRASLVG
ncbi:Mo25-like [Dillenia turbinata]|uniref:Mo25-like n=1 Tax=Dillenia turbinata TaxID=194707 RepID=A0AAN8UVC2_9MAGN